jgi:Leucine-rich repeat (LRR) protein
MQKKMKLNQLDTMRLQYYAKASQRPLEAMRVKVSQAVIPNDLGKFKNLKDLILESNQNNIINLPASIGELHQLLRLIINSEYKALPEAFTNLRKLQILSINPYKNKELAKQICALKSLERLYLYNHNLQALPTEARKLKNLYSVHLTNAKTTHFPKDLSKLPALVDLGIWYSPELN